MFIDRKTQGVKMLVLPNVICRFSSIPTETLASYFIDINKLILKCLERQKSQSSQHNTEGEGES